MYIYIFFYYLIITEITSYHKHSWLSEKKNIWTDMILNNNKVKTNSFIHKLSITTKVHGICIWFFSSSAGQPGWTSSSHPPRTGRQDAESCGIREGALSDLFTRLMSCAHVHCFHCFQCVSLFFLFLFFLFFFPLFFKC